MESERREIFKKNSYFDSNKKLYESSVKAIVGSADPRRRRRFFKSEARHTIYKRGNWLALVFGCFIIMMLVCGIKSVTGGLFGVIDPELLSSVFQRPMPKTEYVGAVLGDVLLVLLVLPIIFGIFNFASDIYESSGVSSGVGEIFENFASAKNLSRCYRIIYSFAWRIVLFAFLLVSLYFGSDIIYQKIYDIRGFQTALAVLVASYVLLGVIFAAGCILMMRNMLIIYIASKNPEMSIHSASKASAYVMRGHKIECFTLFCSFIGWILLSVLTFGILFFMFTLPYMMVTFAAFSEYVYGLKRADIESGNYKHRKKLSIGNIFTDNLNGTDAASEGESNE